MNDIKRLEFNTTDGAQLNMDALYQIAPSVFTESRDARGGVKRAVNFDALRQLLGDNAVDNSSETYEFRWVGKDAAKAEAARPTDKTLRPVVEDSEDWNTTKNLYIEGDNLEVLKLLQRSYMGKVKMIYIDPPYNTGNDFVYHDDFAMSSDEYDEASGATDDLGNKYFKNTETSGRFHSDWCNMIYPRLMVARSLLAEDGVIFISIDDNEQEHLKNICDELFGGENFLAQVIWERAYSPINLMKHFSPSHDYLLCYAKNVEVVNCNGIERSKEANERYSNPDNDPRGVWKPSDLSVGPAVAENIYPITTPSGRVVEPPAGRSWSLSRKAFRERLEDDRIWFGPDGNSVPSMKRFLSELRKKGITPMTIWKYTEVDHSQGATQKLAKLFDGKKYFDYPKPVSLIERCIQLYSDSASIVLDFFSGSATTAHAIMKLNAEDNGKRKFIMVQLPEETEADSAARKAGYNNICDIAKERIRRAAAKIKEESPLTTQDLDTGFRVFRLDDSNFNPGVKASPGEYNQQQLDLFANNIKTDRTDLDLLFGSILAWGLQLDLPMETEEVDGCKIYTVNDGDLVACFAEKVTDRVIEAMAEKDPLRVLFRDSCFDSDDKKINLFETFKQKLDWTDDEAFNNIRVI